MSWVWCDGEFCENTLEISATDRGLCHGLGAFETVLALGGAAVALDLHLARLARAVMTLGLKGIDQPAIAAAIPALLQRNKLHEGRARVRIAATAGSGFLNDLEPGEDARVWISAAAVPAPPPYVSLVTAPFPRNELSPLTGLKTASYAENLLAMNYAREQGADEPLFLNTCGDVCETATANLFLISAGAIITPALESGCLPGTARRRVIELAAELGFKVEERDVRPSELTSASAVFLTSAIRGVVEVAELDGQVLTSVPLTGVLKNGLEAENIARRQTIQ